MRKYRKTTGYYVYMHRTPEKDCYFGKSKQQPVDRWQPSKYKDKSLYPYIEQFGWENIEHVVLFDGLTVRQAEVLEDWFITNARRDGFCINDRRSGGVYRDNPKEYKREYCQRSEVKERERERCQKRRQTEEYKEYQREWQREYQQTEEYKVYQREYRQRPEVKERKLEYQRQYRLKKKLLESNAEIQ